MKKLFKLFALIIPLVTFFSCADDSTEIKSIAKISNNDEFLIPTTAKLIDEKSLRQSATNDIIEAEEFAKLLASSLNDKDVRKFLKNEANKKNDGDFDILVSQVINAKIGIQNFSEKIKNNSPNGLAKGKEVFDNATKNPKLNIAIPVLIEKWDDTKQQPLVAVAIGTIEKETKFLKAFDSKGKSYLIDASIEPNVPVIVVGNNERMNYQSDIKKNKNLRISGNYEKITWLKCPNLSDIESWYYGAPELRFEGVVYNNDFSAAFKAFSNMEYPNNRNQASNGYTLALWTATQNLFAWHFDANHGPDYYIQSYEIDDSGTTQSLTVGVTAGKKDVVTGNASFTLTYKAQDKVLKGELIHYTNSSPATIGDGSIQFTLTN